MNPVVLEEQADIGMNESNVNEMKVELRKGADAWHVVVERDGQRQELGGIDELIRYLERFATTKDRPVRGLR